MKKRVLTYFCIIVAAISLQSCASNYVVSNPIVYKNDAKIASVQNVKVEEEVKELTPSQKIDMALASIEKVNRNAAIQKTIFFEKKIDDLLAEAESYIGTPYRYGGTTRSGIDCSAFVLSVFGATLGINLPRVAASQALEGDKINREELRKGDLLFFSRGGRISHVGIVHNIDENGEVHFIHAATSKGVMISPLNDKYWGPKYKFAKRIADEDTIDLSQYANNKS